MKDQQKQLRACEDLHPQGQIVFCGECQTSRLIILKKVSMRSEHGGKNKGSEADMESGAGFLQQNATSPVISESNSRWSHGGG